MHVTQIGPGAITAAIRQGFLAVLLYSATRVMNGMWLSTDAGCNSF